jgi:hypothetical protein
MPNCDRDATRDRTLGSEISIERGNLWMEGRHGDDKEREINLLRVNIANDGPNKRSSIFDVLLEESLFDWRRPAIH